MLGFTPITNLFAVPDLVKFWQPTDLDQPNVLNCHKVQCELTGRFAGGIPSQNSTFFTKYVHKVLPIKSNYKSKRNVEWRIRETARHQL